MAGHLLDIVGDRVTKFHYSAHDDTWALETVQDVSHYLKLNKYLYNEAQLNPHFRKKEEEIGRLKASVPMEIWHKWTKEFQKYAGLKYPPKMNNPDFKKFVRVKLKDPENRFLRCDGGKD